MFGNSAYSVRRGLIMAVLFSGLALLPSLSWGQRDREKEKEDRESRQAERRAPDSRATAPQAAPSRPPGQERRAEPAPRGPVLGDQGQRTPGLGWRGREESRPGTPASPGLYGRYSAPDRTRQNAGQDTRWRNPYGSERERQRTDQPGQGSTSTDRPAFRPPSPGRDRTAGGGDAYQLYRPGRRESGAGSTGSEDRSSRSDGGRPSRGTEVERGTTGERTPRTTLVRPTLPERGRGGSEAGARGGAAEERPARPERGQIKPRQPEARFRGPEADRSVRLVRPEERQRFEGRVREWVRDENAGRGRPDRIRPGQDVIGNVVPRETRFLIRQNVTNINIHYTQIVNNFGRPGYSYLFTPRGFGDYWDGYWDGYADGYWAWQHHRHRPLIVVNFYYPFYFSDPYFFAFYYEGYRPAVYTYFGWGPAWIYPSRVYYAPAEYYYTPVTPYRYYQGYYQGGSDLDYAGAEQAIGDLRRGWMNADIAPIASHLTDRLDIRVYFDGEYSYTTSTDDFYAMTLDTLATTQTAAMDFDEPLWVTSHEVFYTGRQVFYDPDGERHTIYVSFRLRHLGDDWYLVAIGTSNDPIQHQYRDFRYQ